MASPPSTPPAPRAPHTPAQDRAAPPLDPALTAPDPAATASDPASSAPDSAATATNPALTTSIPAATTSDPTATAPDSTATAPDPAASTPLLELRALCLSYPAPSLWGRPWAKPAPTLALDGLSLRILPGQAVALVGESGSGKSSAARAILRFVEADSGQILFQNQDVRAMSRAQLRRFRLRAQMVFQDPLASLNPRQTVGQCLAEPLRAHRIAPDPHQRRTRIAALLTQVGLDPALANRYPHTLSGGQRQRVTLARALSVEPALLILDEPLSALDLRSQGQLLDLLQRLQSHLGLSYLLISHDLSVVQQLCSEAHVLQRGRIVESGPPQRLFTTPQHPHTRQLLDALPPLYRSTPPTPA